MSFDSCSRPVARATPLGNIPSWLRNAHCKSLLETLKNGYWIRNKVLVIPLSSYCSQNNIGRVGGGGRGAVLQTLVRNFQPVQFYLPKGKVVQHLFGKKNGSLFWVTRTWLNVQPFGNPGRGGGGGLMLQKLYATFVTRLKYEVQESYYPGGNTFVQILTW